MATETERSWLGGLSAMTVRAESTRPSQKRGFSSLVLGCALSLLSSLPRSTQPLSMPGRAAGFRPPPCHEPCTEKTKQSETPSSASAKPISQQIATHARIIREVWVELLSFAGRERSSVMDDMTPMLARHWLVRARGRV